MGPTPTCLDVDGSCPDSCCSCRTRCSLATPFTAAALARCTDYNNNNNNNSNNKLLTFAVGHGKRGARGRVSLPAAPWPSGPVDLFIGRNWPPASESRAHHGSRRVGFKLETCPTNGAVYQLSSCKPKRIRARWTHRSPSNPLCGCVCVCFCFVAFLGGGGGWGGWTGLISRVQPRKFETGTGPNDRHRPNHRPDRAKKCFVFRRRVTRRFNPCVLSRISCCFCLPSRRVSPAVPCRREGLFTDFFSLPSTETLWMNGCMNESPPAGRDEVFSPFFF